MMIIRLFLMCLTLLSLQSNLQAGIWDEVVNTFKGRTRADPPTIRVLVLHDKDKINLEVRGKYSLYDPYTRSYLSSRFVGKSRTIEALNSGLKWGESFPGLYQLKIRPDEAKTLTAINGKEYMGDIYIYDIGNTISIVNQLTIEDYTRSIVAEYQKYDLLPETLAALAIATRTNAYFQAVNPKNTYWAIDGEKVGFQGRLPVAPVIEQALQTTRYMIMSRTGVYEKVATPFAAEFDSSIATQLFKDVEVSKISIDEANKMAENGEHAAQILAKAFPGTTIMLLQYSDAN